MAERRELIRELNSMGLKPSLDSNPLPGFDESPFLLVGTEQDEFGEGSSAFRTGEGGISTPERLGCGPMDVRERLRGQYGHLLDNSMVVPRRLEALQRGQFASRI